ncbi:hypothetical protein MKW92_011310 [Papaver armeniacum]|nr:hypothetical protein MKW92_011310 [Papaver armeniacum]
MVNLIDNWGSTGSDFKMGIIDRYFNYVSSIQSAYIKALNGVVDQECCPTKDSLLHHVKVLKELDSKLSHEWHESDNLFNETYLKEKLAYLNLFQMKLLIWDILDVRGYISISHVEWMEECVSDFGCRDEIEDYIFDTKRSCYPFFEKKEESRSKRKRSSAFNLQDYTSLKRKRDRERYIQEIRGEYMVLDEKCKRIANQVMQFSELLTTRDAKFDIPRYRLKSATFISRLSSLARIHPQWYTLLSNIQVGEPRKQLGYMPTN